MSEHPQIILPAGMVPPLKHCHWLGCPDVAAVIFKDFPLTPDGQDREFIIDIPLCKFHRAQAKDTARIDLNYHPSLGSRGLDE